MVVMRGKKSGLKPTAPKRKWEGVDIEMGNHSNARFLEAWVSRKTFRSHVQPARVQCRSRIVGAVVFDNEKTCRNI